MAQNSGESGKSSSANDNGHQSSFDDDDFIEDRLSILLAAGAQEANYNKNKAKKHREKRQHKRTVSFADEQDLTTTPRGHQVDLAQVCGVEQRLDVDRGVTIAATNHIPGPHPLHPRNLHECVATPSGDTDVGLARQTEIGNGQHSYASTPSIVKTGSATIKSEHIRVAGTAVAPSSGGNGDRKETSRPEESPRTSISPSRKGRGHRRSITNEYLRKVSSVLDDSLTELDVDSSRLNRCLADAGAYSAGIAAVEVWVLDGDETGTLVRPPGGWWRNNEDENVCLPMSEALAMLEDKTHPNFIAADPVLPGVDLAGELWAESAPEHADVVPGSGGTSGQKTLQASAIPGSGAGDEEAGDANTVHLTNKAPPQFYRSSTCATQGSDQNTSRIVEIGEDDNPDQQGGSQATKLGMDDSGHSRLSRWMTGSSDSRLAVRLTKSFDNRLAIRFGMKAATNAVHIPGGYHHRSTFDGGVDDRGHSGWWSEAARAPIHHPHPRRALNWRDIPSLVANPDQAQTPRLALFERAGLVSAVAVPFDVSNHQGIVIYYSTTAAEELNNDTATTHTGSFREYRSDSDSRHPTTAMANQVYMIRAAHLVGSVIATTDARRASVALMHTRAKVENNFSTEKDLFGGDSQLGGERDKEKTRAGCCPDLREQAGKRVRVWAQKCKGGNLQIPPPATMRQAMWTLAGVFVGLLTLSGINRAISLSVDGGNFILLGPMGALMALQYSLTAAPASQPRNAILGQIVCGSIALLFTYVPEVALPPWIRTAVAPAVSISVMTRMGIVHPPAGAASVLLASGRYGWVHYVGLVLSTVVSLLPAIAINNWSQKRQYPTYWGYLPVMATNAVRKRVAERETQSWKVTNVSDRKERSPEASSNGEQRKGPGDVEGGDELDSIA